MRFFANIPFLRILLPLVFGILFELKFKIPSVGLFVLLLNLMVIIVVGLIKRTNTIYKITFLFACDVFLFLLAINTTHYRDKINSEHYYGHLITAERKVLFTAIIDEIPTENEKHVKCNLRVKAIKTDSCFRNVSANVMAYFKKPLKRDKLRLGQLLAVKAKFSEIPEPKNPDEFNYRNYLYNKQIYHLVFLDSVSYESIYDHSYNNSLWYFGQKCKEFVLQKIKSSSLSFNAYSISSALLTGYDDDIEKPVLEAFSHSGTLHVLSVSGLHVGLIYLLLNTIFNFFDRSRRFKLLNFALVFSVLWFFALVTGFSPPVLRAVIMFSLFGIGKIWFQNSINNQLNILAVSAFILLFYNPFFITDIGFLLSYFALAGIIYFQPNINLLWAPQNFLLKYIWQSLSVSIAATIATLPLTLYLFKQFPIWFFLCNVVVVPISFAVLILTVPIILNVGFLAPVVNFLVSFLIGFINFFDSEKFGFVDNIHFTGIDAVFLSSLIVLSAFIFEIRSYKWVLFAFCVIIFWQFNSLISSLEAKNGSQLTVYQLNRQSAYLVKNTTHVFLNRFPLADYNYHIKPSVISFNYPALTVRDFNYVETKEGNVLFLNRADYWPKITPNISTLVISNNFKLSENEIIRFKGLRTLVADGSNSVYELKNIGKLCRKFGITFYPTRYKGAYNLILK